MARRSSPAPVARWLSVAEAAAWKGVSRHSIHWARKQQHLVCVQPDGPQSPWLVDAASLAAWTPQPPGRRAVSGSDPRYAFVEAA